MIVPQNDTGLLTDPYDKEGPQTVRGYEHEKENILLQVSLAVGLSMSMVIGMICFFCLYTCLRCRYNRRIKCVHNQPHSTRPSDLLIEQVVTELTSSF